MKNIIYLNDKELTLIRTQIYNYELSSLSKGAINNVKTFNQEFSQIIKQQKINRGLIGEDLKIYINEPISPINETFYKEIFTDLGFNNIELQSINIFLEEKNTIYLISNKYSNFIYHNSFYFELPTISILENFTYKNPIKIFGNNPNINTLKNTLKSKVKTQIFLYYPPENYILNLIKKIM